MEWSEFETFVANEIQEGRDFMDGEFVLPSGAGIQFAAMVDVLRRKSRLQAVMKVTMLNHTSQRVVVPMSCMILCKAKACKRLQLQILCTCILPCC